MGVDGSSAMRGDGWGTGRRVSDCVSTAYAFIYREAHLRAHRHQRHECTVLGATNSPLRLYALRCRAASGYPARQITVIHGNGPALSRQIALDYSAKSGRDPMPAILAEPGGNAMIDPLSGIPANVDVQPDAKKLLRRVPAGVRALLVEILDVMERSAQEYSAPVARTELIAERDLEDGTEKIAFSPP